MSQEWEITFDKRAFIARYPQFFQPEDDDLWREFGEAELYSRNALERLIHNDEADLGFRARAAAVAGLPWEYRPVHWCKGRKIPQDRKNDAGMTTVSPVIQQLTCDLQCCFMESLSESPAFDRSGHKLLPRIWQINDLLRRYLIPSEGDSRSEWLDPWRQRVFDCYRLQGQVLGYSNGRKPFYAFKNLMFDDREADLHWKKQAEQKIRPMIEGELAGEAGYAGALASYLNSIHYSTHWCGEPELGMGPEPYPVSLETKMVEYVLGLETPVEQRIPNESITDFVRSIGYAHRWDLLEELGRQIFVDREAEDNKDTYDLAMKMVEELESSSAALEAVTAFLATASERRATARRAEEERQQRVQEILKRMRPKKGDESFD